MRTTTVVWKTLQMDQGPDRSPEYEAASAARKQRFFEAAFNLAGEMHKVPVDETLVKDENDELSTTVTRAWPSLEVAESWVTFVLAEGAVSAVVNPE